ncbi:hypothetical protein IM792_10610 [Mucilaginibacter sp. JRF]|uniref:hypothetical protein n=1 Tax=Mucilaginibacter sp. JRF TaxID=2780088 RepID=UPI001881E441|nr:hypothetical protein [Mucilaginibacter sp. JRF]MBE9584899.1 hypothetical protein [Mucilaginibacter sp. JRF]
MNKYLLFLLLLTCKIELYAQKINPNAQYYIGKTFHVDTLAAKYQDRGYDYFRANLSVSLYDSKYAAYPNKSGYSDYQALANKTMTCTAVGEVPGNESYGYLKLESSTTYPIHYVYFKGSYFRNITCIEEEAENKILKEKEIAYRKRLSDSITLAATKLRNNPCPLITENYDEFENIKSFQTPWSFEGKMLNCSIAKIIEKRVPYYYVSLSTIGNTALATQKGVFIILKNGKRIVKPNAEIETNVDRNAQFERTTTIKLTTADLALLKSSPMSKFKLYINSDNIQEADLIYKMLLCLITKK